MKQLIFLVFLMIPVLFCEAQTNNLPPLDKSPMDMSYYPTNYPVLKIQDKATDVDTWGAFKYDVQKDVLRTTVPVQMLNEAVEALAMNFEKADNGCNLIIAWDNVKIVLPINIK